MLELIALSMRAGVFFFCSGAACLDCAASLSMQPFAESVRARGCGIHFRLRPHFPSSAWRSFLAFITLVALLEWEVLWMRLYMKMGKLTYVL